MMYKSLAKKAERKRTMRELDPDTHCLVLVWGTCNVYSTLIIYKSLAKKAGTRMAMSEREADVVDPLSSSGVGLTSVLAV